MAEHISYLHHCIFNDCHPSVLLTHLPTCSLIRPHTHTHTHTHTHYYARRGHSGHMQKKCITSHAIQLLPAFVGNLLTQDQVACKHVRTVTTRSAGPQLPALLIWHSHDAVTRSHNALANPPLSPPPNHSSTRSFSCSLDHPSCQYDRRGCLVLHESTDQGCGYLYALSKQSVIKMFHVPGEFTQVSEGLDSIAGVHDCSV